MIFKYFKPNPESKTQKKKLAERKPTVYVGCSGCHSMHKTLIKSTDGYYCKDCLEKLKKERC